MLYTSSPCDKLHSKIAKLSNFGYFLEQKPQVAMLYIVQLIEEAAVG